MKSLVKDEIGLLNSELQFSDIPFAELNFTKIELNRLVGIGSESQLGLDSQSEIDRDLNQPALLKSAALKYSRAERKITGSSRADQLVGTRANDFILGQGGNDELYGEKGNDRILGGKGNDYLQGGKGNDRLYGGTGNDVLMSGRIVGQADQYDGLTRIEEDGFFNYLTGGSGKDTFVLASRGKGVAYIEDFRNGVDQFALSEGMSLGNISVDYYSINDRTRIFHGDNMVAAILGDVTDQITTDDFSYV